MRSTLGNYFKDSIKPKLIITSLHSINFEEIDEICVIKITKFIRTNKATVLDELDEISANYSEILPI